MKRTPFGKWPCPIARTVDLLGEPVGRLPEMKHITRRTLPGVLGHLRASTGSILRISFFLTNQMRAQLHYAQLNGTLPILYTFLARSGKTIMGVEFVKLEPGIGKLLGILSLQSLPRRITLDFRDVFSDGFAFDSIQGSVKIDRGIASTLDELQRVLLDVANSPAEVTPAQFESIQKRIAAQGILLKVRVVRQELRSESQRKKTEPAQNDSTVKARNKA